MPEAILALDTCFDACSAALRGAAPAEATGVRDIAERLPMASGHAEALMPMIARLLERAQLPASGIGRIIVTRGPGTFTGTRIAIAAGRGLALATGASIAALSSLRVVGMTALQAQPQLSGVFVAMAARNGEVYAEVVCPAGPSEPMVQTLADAAQLAVRLSLAVVGTGAREVAEAGQTLGRAPAVIDADAWPDARTMLGLGADPCLAAGSPVPLYLRPPDAKPPTSPALPRQAS